MRYFTLGELCYSATAHKLRIPNIPSPDERKNLILLVENILDPLRHHLGVPIIVNSGYRCARLNKAIGGAATSQHVKGQAADIRCANISPHEIIAAMVKLVLPFDQVINEFQAWVHVSYSSEKVRGKIMEAYKYNGKTIYRKINNA